MGPRRWHCAAHSAPGLLASVYQLAILVKVRIGTAGSEFVENELVVLGCGLEVPRHPKVRLARFFVEFDADSRGIGHLDVTVLDDRFGRPGYQVSPPVSPAHMPQMNR